MSDTSPSPVPVETGKPSFWDRVSPIWLVPIIALAVALGAAWRTYSDQGPLVEITFDNAAGVKADETVLRYRDIEVGVVEDVHFSGNLEKVRVMVRLDKELADYVDADARFWVVRPEVTARGVSGLDTVLSGVYIQGVWDSEPAGFRPVFEGLPTAPLIGADQQGTQFILHSEESLPAAGTPIIYKGVDVGQIGEARITSDGTGVSAPAVIYAPHTELVTSATRFWDVSGFSFSLGAAGARLNFDSFASLISGGITFETLGSGGTPLSDDARFELFSDEDAARDDFLVEGDGQSVDLTMIFDQNLSGLAVGAPVELGGLRVGEVASITGLVDAERFGDNEVHLLTTVRISPSRIGLGEGAAEEELFAYLERRVAEGLRAQLTNASLLTGGLKVVLVEVPGAEPAELDRDGTPYTVMPTTDAEVTDVATSAQGVLQRVNDLPIEEVMQSAIGFLDNATALIGSQALQEAPEELRGILSAVRGVAESEDVQALPTQAAALMADLQEISGALSTIVAELEAQEVATKLTTAIENVGTAAEGLPGLVAQTEGILANAGEVSLETLANRTSDLLASAEALIDQPSTRDLPAALNGALDELRQTLALLRDGGLVENANATLASARDAASAIEAATELLPGIATQLRSVAAQADTTLSAYSRDSEFSRETRTAIRQIEAAAASIERLARTIERNPNSLILGR